jgi:hypothetical protein
MIERVWLGDVFSQIGFGECRIEWIMMDYSVLSGRMYALQTYKGLPQNFSVVNPFFFVIWWDLDLLNVRVKCTAFYCEKKNWLSQLNSVDIKDRSALTDGSP